MRFSDLRKSFTGESGLVQAVAGVSGTIAPGRITGLVGPDAAGKTTLIRMLAGLLTSERGTIERPAGHVGYMPQKFGLYEDLTVGENLALYADLHGLKPDVREQTFARLHKFTGLAPFVDRLAGKLSGGMKQKLGLACTLVVAPEVLLLDEPSVGVDPVSRRELWSMVRSLQDTGIAVLWSTAYLDEAERCDHVILLHEGKVLFDGPPKELTARYDGRTWRIPLPSDTDSPKKRELQRAASALPGVVDAQVQGRALRIVVGADAPAPALPGLKAEPATARLEDAYLAMLDTPHRPPPPVPSIAANGNGHLIETRDLTRRFGAFTAVDRISFDVKRGEIFGLLGPNGAGKSTTFKMLCGLLPASSGDARVAGFDLRVARADARGRLGYMAQKFAYLGDLTVAQNMDFSAGVYGIADTKAKIAAAIADYGLEAFKDERTGQLPLGIKQRMALACAVMHNPAILFLDEPTSGVDPVTRHEFWERINAMAAAGMTVLVTSHFIDEAEYCDRLAIIYRGKIIGLGSPEEIKAKHDREGAGLEAAFINLVESYDRDHPQ